MGSFLFFMKNEKEGSIFLVSYVSIEEKNESRDADEKL